MNMAIVLPLFSLLLLATENLKKNLFFYFLFLISHFGDTSPVEKRKGWLTQDT
jgi:hypothetical protein